MLVALLRVPELDDIVTRPGIESEERFDKGLHLRKDTILRYSQKEKSHSDARDRID